MKKFLSVPGAVTVLVVATCPSLVWASPGVYVPVIQEVLGVSPECTVCHTTPSGGDGTATKPFALTLVDLGLMGDSNVASLRAALAALPETADSDKDGFTDLIELTEGGDPNDSSVGPGGAVPPEYGCVGGTIAGPARSADPMALTLSVLVGAALLFSRRRRHRR